jgi:hypothetical protein
MRLRDGLSAGVGYICCLRVLISVTLNKMANIPHYNAEVLTVIPSALRELNTLNVRAHTNSVY